MVKSFLFKVEDLRNYIIRFLTQLKVSRADAEITADILLAADLRGVDSHGIIRLDTYYGSRLRKGLIDPTLSFQSAERDSHNPGNRWRNGHGPGGELPCHAIMHRKSTPVRHRHGYRAQ